MTVISVNDLTKVFKIPRKEPGLRGAVKGLFVPKFEYKTAVDHINFQLEAGEIVGYILSILKQGSYNINRRYLAPIYVYKRTAVIISLHCVSSWFGVE